MLYVDTSILATPVLKKTERNWRSTSSAIEPVELGWEAFSRQTLDAAAASARPVIFDLASMKDISGVLRGTGQYANTITGMELRYIQANCGTFQGNVTLMSGGVPVGVPW